MSDVCPSCKMGSLAMGQGFMVCRNCGMSYRMDHGDILSAPFGEYTSDGKRILQVYGDFVYGVSVVTTNDFGEYVYGRGYNPETGLWVGGDYRYTPEELGDFIEGRLLIDNVGWGHIGEGARRDQRIRRDGRS